MSRLARPLRRFAQESAWLSREFSVNARVRGDTARLACEMAIVRLHDSWARSCRDLVVRSACGNTRTLGGTVLAPSPLVSGGEGSVIPALLGTYKRRKSEPKWFDSADCIEAAQNLKVHNLSSIAAGLGAITSPADALRNVRNFYAHRGMRTARQASQYGIFSKPSVPDVFELANASRPGQSHLDFWILGLTDTLRAAAQ